MITTSEPTPTITWLGVADEPGRICEKITQTRVTRVTFSTRFQSNRRQFAARYSARSAAVSSWAGSGSAFTFRLQSRGGRR